MSFWQASDYARFRKELFRNLAGQYYQLILTYRNIEIDTQNYFTNLRGFNQREAEFEAGRISQNEVDQFEQHIRAIAGWPLGDGSRRDDGDGHGYHEKEEENVDHVDHEVRPLRSTGPSKTSRPCMNAALVRM